MDDGDSTAPQSPDKYSGVSGITRLLVFAGQSVATIFQFQRKIMFGRQNRRSALRW
ncbi:hypothetical protein PGTUg99_001647 [Puccinia graminis f. sp. tritici]|uniref:Uncharacterized protein n=1 Tax=Puccinia graminis f. sp. tritici TaxID=56615 RepID=A0A5B0S922_PUCGR|nr:hypothetical protein PGTUg99_001647 [Puccinia graminis f. sp. tritici]